MERPYETLYFDLSKNLLIPSLFYLTDQILEQMDSETREQFTDFTNKLIFLDSELGPLPIGKELIAHRLLSKQLQLDGNIHQLLKCNKTEQESFVQDKYIQQVKGYRIILKWLLDNSRIYIDKIKKDHSNALKIQLDQVSRHKEELEERFGVNTAETVESNPESTEMDQEQIKTLFLSESNNLNLQDILPKKQNKREKLKYLRDVIWEEGEQAILETIFNVKHER